MDFLCVPLFDVYDPLYKVLLWIMETYNLCPNHHRPRGKMSKDNLLCYLKILLQ